ncbi:MAG: hypothetical protein R2795_15575 [Saprospiraceae bacterium]
MFIDFYAIIDIGTQDYGLLPSQINKRKLTIGGERFERVITKYPRKDGRKKFQFYINKQAGIVGFTDKEGKTWRIKYMEKLMD